MVDAAIATFMAAQEEVPQEAFDILVEIVRPVVQPHVDPTSTFTTRHSQCHLISPRQ